jgi:hypothetical protein
VKRERIGLTAGSIALLFSLCACGGGGLASPPAGAPLQRIRASWTLPDLSQALSPLLFVSDAGTADVYIYKLPALTVVATITGFSQPQGECSGNSGDVWVTDANSQTIYELSHRGQLDNALNDATGYPDGCAWDPSTGNLAVMSLFGTGSSAGSVLVFKKGSYNPKRYRVSGQYYYNFAGYDGSGNLFFDGRDANGNFMLSELPKGASSGHALTVKGGTIYFPGMVQWDAARSELVVGDQSCGDAYVSCLYRLRIGAKGATIVGHIDLKGYSGSPICDLVQGVIYQNKIAGSDNDFCGYTPSATYLWPYPGGGSPAHHNSTTDSTPVGAAISL